jgi:hypothetical protein
MAAPLHSNQNYTTRPKSPRSNSPVLTLLNFNQATTLPEGIEVEVKDIVPNQDAHAALYKSYAQSSNYLVSKAINQPDHGLLSIAIVTPSTAKFYPSFQVRVRGSFQDGKFKNMGISIKTESVLIDGKQSPRIEIEENFEDQNPIKVIENLKHYAGGLRDKIDQLAPDHKNQDDITALHAIIDALQTENANVLAAFLNNRATYNVLYAAPEQKYMPMAYFGEQTADMGQAFDDRGNLCGAVRMEAELELKGNLFHVFNKTASANELAQLAMKKTHKFISQSVQGIPSQQSKVQYAIEQSMKNQGRKYGNVIKGEQIQKFAIEKSQKGVSLINFIKNNCEKIQSEARHLPKAKSILPITEEHHDAFWSRPDAYKILNILKKRMPEAYKTLIYTPKH